MPHSEQEYNKLVNILDQLIDEIGDNETHQLAAVMETIGKLIESYEDQHFAVNETSAIDTLKYLMQEHNLKPSDLKEIGSQGVVSEVLSGKRNLNIEQIKRLSKRFHISPSALI